MNMQKKYLFYWRMNVRAVKRLYKRKQIDEYLTFGEESENMMDSKGVEQIYCEERGTELNYRVLSETIANVRCGAPMAANWKEKIERDYKERKNED